MNPGHRLRITLLQAETATNPVKEQGVRLKMNNLKIQ
jgi:hypothetical protein